MKSMDYRGNGIRVNRAQSPLAWLWITWVRKHNLGFDTLRAVRDQTTNAKIRDQAELVLQYYGIK